MNNRQARLAFLLTTVSYRREALILSTLEQRSLLKSYEKCLMLSWERPKKFKKENN